MIDWSTFTPPTGWKRSGGEWRGPCPVHGEGRTKAWAKPNEKLLGCRLCAPDGLHGEDFREHAAALGILIRRDEASPVVRPVRQQAKPAPVRKKSASAAPVRLWALAGTVPAIGRSYLTARGAWSTSDALPSSVRWITLEAYYRVDHVWPLLPNGAVGALVYRFMTPDDGQHAVTAVQVEALDDTGRRLLFHRQDGERMKRPSLHGSNFNRGRRVFVGRWPSAPPPADIWIVEGPLDALALTDWARRHRPEAAVVGVPGTSGFRLEAVEAAPANALIVVGADADEAGRDAAVRLGRELERAGRKWEARRPPDGGDWCDWALDRAEREATQQDA